MQVGGGHESRGRVCSVDTELEGGSLSPSLANVTSVLDSLVDAAQSQECPEKASRLSLFSQPELLTLREITQVWFF